MQARKPLKSTNSKQSNVNGCFGDSFFLLSKALNKAQCVGGDECLNSSEILFKGIKAKGVQSLCLYQCGYEEHFPHFAMHGANVQYTKRKEKALTMRNLFSHVI